MNISLWDIYKRFVKIGTILIGGGYVILPILKKEAIEDKKWLTEDELIDYYAISQSIPGLIAINIAIFTGYKLKGVLGAISALSGIITSPFLCIVILASFLSKLNDYILFKHILQGVELGVLILIISSVKEMWGKAITDNFSLISFFIFLTAILVFNISPAQIIIYSIIAGLLCKTLLNTKGAPND